MSHKRNQDFNEPSRKEKLIEQQITLVAFRRCIATFIHDAEELLHKPDIGNQHLFLEKFATDICSIYDFSQQLCRYGEAPAETGHMIQRILYEPILIGNSAEAIPLLEAAESYLQKKEGKNQFSKIIDSWSHLPQQTKKLVNDLRYLAIDL